MGLYKHANSPCWYYSFMVIGQRVTGTRPPKAKTLAKQLGGWKSLELVMRYSHLAPDHKQGAVDKSGAIFSGALILLNFSPKSV